MSKGCVLVVDDGHMIQNVYEKVLSSAGYEHIAFHYAEDALYFLMINHSAIDLVLIIDVLMPKISGTEITKHMARIDPDLPVVIMTGSFEAVHVQENVRAVLQKPITKVELLAAIERHKRQPSQDGCHVKLWLPPSAPRV